MPTAYKYLQTDTKIIKLQILDSLDIAIATQADKIQIFSHQDGNIKVEFQHIYLNETTKKIIFSSNGKILLIINQDKLHIIDIQTKSQIQSIKFDVETISSISFDSSSNYIMIGTTLGRVLQYKYNNSLLLSRVCSFPNHKNNKINLLTFYENLMICSDCRGSIYIVNLDTKISKKLLCDNKITINDIVFIDKNKILIGDTKGDLYIYLIKEDLIEKRINVSFLAIKQIALLDNKNYVLVHSQTNLLVMVDIKNYKIVDKRYIELNVEIDNIVTFSNKLFITLKNSRVLYIELADRKTLASLIAHNSLDEAFKLIFNEPILKGTLEHQELEKKYNDIFMQTINALIDKNQKLANILISMIQDIPSKKEEIQNLFTGFKQYDKFQILVYNQKYNIAYAMCDKFPSLRYTDEYKEMEILWKKIFSKAQKEMIRKRVDIAKDILGKYMITSSKRVLIKFILNHTQEFISFLKAIEQKDFLQIEILLKKHQVFHQIPSYIELYSEIENQLLKIKESLKTGNIKMANINIYKLKDIPHIQNDIEELKLKSKQISIFYKAYNHNDFKSCYELLDSYDFLLETQLGIFLEKHWSKQMKKYEKYALDGDIKSLKNLLGELITLPTRKEKIGELLRVSFHSKIKTLIINQHFFKAEKLIYYYFDIFAQDIEIQIIKGKFEKISSIKLAITENQMKRVPRDEWLNSELIL